MAERNQGVDEGQRITFRIGINLGDIIIDGDDILGDVLNRIARDRGPATEAPIELFPFVQLEGLLGEMWSGVGIDDFGLHGGEQVVEFVADGEHRDQDEDRDAGEYQAIFDGGSRPLGRKIPGEGRCAAPLPGDQGQEFWHRGSLRTFAQPGPIPGSGDFHNTTVPAG